MWPAHWPSEDMKEGQGQGGPLVECLLPPPRSSHSSSSSSSSSSRPVAPPRALSASAVKAALPEPKMAGPLALPAPIEPPVPNGMRCMPRQHPLPPQDNGSEERTKIKEGISNTADTLKVLRGQAESLAAFSKSAAIPPPPTATAPLQAVAAFSKSAATPPPATATTPVQPATGPPCQQAPAPASTPQLKDVKHVPTPEEGSRAQGSRKKPKKETKDGQSEDCSAGSQRTAMGADVIPKLVAQEWTEISQETCSYMSEHCVLCNVFVGKTPQAMNGHIRKTHPDMAEGVFSKSKEMLANAAGGKASPCHFCGKTFVKEHLYCNFMTAAATVVLAKEKKRKTLAIKDSATAEPVGLSWEILDQPSPEVKKCDREWQGFQMWHYEGAFFFISFGCIWLRYQMTYS